MPECKHRFTVISRNSRHVRVRVTSSCNGEQWATNGILTFTAQEWEQFAKWIVAPRANCEIVYGDYSNAG